ncbi:MULTISPECIES: hypothetical protein [Methylobacterium]|nr:MULTISPECIES: hypothetical protein [Methylobacterium]GBU19822.1 hypothetical protein AwMethylo_40370 [Methylobacterium sp.]
MPKPDRDNVSRVIRPDEAAARRQRIVGLTERPGFASIPIVRIASARLARARKGDMMGRLMLVALVATVAATEARAEPDYVAQASQLSCSALTRRTVDSRAWRQGGTPDGSPDAPFGVPVYAWTKDVWRAFQNRAVECNKDKQAIEGSVITALISSSYRENGALAEQAAEGRDGLRSWKLSILNGARNAIDAGGTTEELSAKLDGLRRLAAAPPSTASAKRGGVRGTNAGGTPIAQADIDEVNAALLKLEDKIRSSRLAEAEAWEKGKSDRDAKAEADRADAARRAADDARIQRFMREKAEAEATQRAEVEAKLRREERDKAEAKRAEDERLKVEREARLAAEKAEETKLANERMAKACPSLQAKNAYYDGRMKRSMELGEKLKNAPEISLNGPGPACPFLNDQISIYREMHDDLYACLGSGEPQVKQAVENMTGMVMLFTQQKQGIGCP